MRKVGYKVFKNHRSREFIQFLKELELIYPKEKIKILMDNHKIHTSRETREYLKTVPDKFELAVCHTFCKIINFKELLTKKYRIRRLISQTVYKKLTLNLQKIRDTAFEFVFTPKHASWLNIIETFFSKMARSLLRGIRVDSLNELKMRISQYINKLNEKPVIFKWKYKIQERDEMPGKIIV